MQSDTQQEPVTVIVRRRVKIGHQERYEKLVHELTKEAGSMAGYLGTNIYRPENKGQEYTSVFRFDTVENLKQFEVSELRNTFLREVTPHVEADAIWERMTGLEFWFSPPPDTKVPQPSPFRMAILLIIVVYGLVLSIGWLVGQVLITWPYPLRLLVTIAIEVFLMTYLLMPRLTRWLARWIYPG
ncbi:MAG: antibiotic biosynthesis monooxygenase [Rhodothermaceae bacterium]|nr:antibiotic biosynthesis monooxygenase [Rhodothermaceae bacterium]